MDAVDEAGVDRVADDHFLAGLHRGQQHIEDAVQPPGNADALLDWVVCATIDP